MKRARTVHHHGRLHVRLRQVFADQQHGDGAVDPLRQIEADAALDFAQLGEPFVVLADLKSSTAAQDRDDRPHHQEAAAHSLEGGTL
jgi:hypothetical protein